MIASHSPEDNAIVWQGDATDANEIASIVDRAFVAQAAWMRTSLDERCEVMNRYASYLTDHQADFAELLQREVGKLPADAVSEVKTSIAKVSLTIQSLRERRCDRRSEADAIVRQVRYRPLGVVAVLGPFNFPLHLPGAHILPALLAGNAVVFKPSEQAIAIGHAMQTAWHHTGLDPDLFQLVIGGANQAKRLIDDPRVRGVFLTGSRETGLALRRQLVERYEVQLAMELGGNNPIVVTPGVDPQAAASIVTHSAFVSSGQRCSCARRLIVVEPQRGDTTPLVDAIIAKASTLRLGMPSERPVPQLGPLISKLAVERVLQTHEKLLRLGCRSLLAPRTDPARPTLLGPAVVDATSLSREAFRTLGDWEWFGPLLVIRLETSVDAAIESAAATSYGLTAALLGGDAMMFDRFVDAVGAGVVNWNRGTTGAAGVQPFGGLGLSGNHQPAGFFAIDSCNDPVASLESSTLESRDPWSTA